MGSFLGASPIIWVAFGIILLLVLNMKFKLNSILALLISAIVVGLLEGMELVKVVNTIKSGFGSTLGSLALIVAFGAVLGKFMVDSGASQRIAKTILAKVGVKYIQWGILLVGIIFGLSMFYEVAFMILAPLIMSIAKEAKISFMKLEITMVAAATSAHSLFPPQPGPVALVSAYGADIGMVYIIGIIVIIPTIICSGLIYPKLIGKSIKDIPMPVLAGGDTQEINEKDMPSFGISLLVPLIPAIIMIAATIFKPMVGAETATYALLSFFGSAEISMLVAVIVGIFVFGLNLNKNMNQMMDAFADAIKNVATVILIIGAGGAFKQVILDSGVGAYIATLMQGSSFSPLIMAWLITIILRLATGAGTVSAITAAGIVGPLIPVFNVNPALMVLATASGSNTLTHVNDASFWLFKETFGLSLKDTFKTWGGLELINSVVGLIIVLILSLFIH
ncbi:gluconate permease [Clostridium beijerinckii]|nr:gluconate permease [Clostridium beijerinckii]